MKLLSLFSGIGGIDLAARWAGIETVAFCEIEPFCQKVLAKHWPGVPIFNDVRTLTAESLRARGVESVDIIAGGFPCQPFSTAGQRRGKEDNRHLWPQMRRVIAELRPRWVIGENVAGIINVALDDVLSEMEAEGYAAQAFVIPACAVNAPHRRDRVWIVAHSERWGRQGREPELAQGGGEARGERRQQADGATGRGGVVVDAVRGGCLLGEAADAPEQDSDQQDDGLSRPPSLDEWRTGNADGAEWWAVEPDVGRVAHGIPRRVDRLRGLGNAVVPQVVYPIFEAIMKLEREAA